MTVALLYGLHSEATKIVELACALFLRHSQPLARHWSSPLNGAKDVTWRLFAAGLRSLLDVGVTGVRSGKAAALCLHALLELSAHQPRQEAGGAPGPGMPPGEWASLAGIDTTVVERYTDACRYLLTGTEPQVSSASERLLRAAPRS